MLQKDSLSVISKAHTQCQASLEAVPDRAGLSQLSRWKKMCNSNISSIFIFSVDNRPRLNGRHPGIGCDGFVGD